jgi:mono/diheme cytochrome c family protein
MGFLRSLGAQQVEAIAGALMAQVLPSDYPPKDFGLNPPHGEVGTPVTVSVAPGVAGRFYKYWVSGPTYCENTALDWQVIQDWTTALSARWTPSQPGKYVIVVWITKDTSQGCVEMIGGSYGVGEADDLSQAEVHLSRAGGRVNEQINMGAVGGQNNLRYKFMVNTTSYCDPTQSPNWLTVQDWSTSNTCSFVPVADGLYTLVVLTAEDTNDSCTGIAGMSYAVGEMTPPAASDGATLYGQNCASCHGSLGSSTKRGATVARLQGAISGNIGGMGSLISLTAEQIQKIVDALVGTSVPPVALDGAALYSRNCASCHGGLATSTKPRATASRIQGAISGNVGGMGYLTFLSSQEIQAIATALAQPVAGLSPTTRGWRLLLASSSTAATKKVLVADSRVFPGIGGVAPMRHLSAKELEDVRNTPGHSIT